MDHFSLLLLSFTLYTLASSEIAGVYFITEPADQSVAPGTHALLPCKARSQSLPPPKITWKKDGVTVVPDLDGGEPARAIYPNGSLLVSPVQRFRGNLLDGNYQCIATAEGVGSILSRTAKVSILPPFRFTEEPEDITVGRRQTARFGCAVDIIPIPLIVQWYKNNELIVVDRTRMTTLPSGSLEIRLINESDEGLYHCIVNSADFPSRKGRLLLSENPLKNIPPVFTVTPRSQVAAVGTPVLFECSAVSYPLPTISWLKDGVTLDLSKVGSRLLKIGEGNLLLSRVEESDRGTYQCRAENAEDSVDVSAVLEVHVAPRTKDKTMHVYGFEKSDVELPCAISGSPTPTIQWYKNGDRIIEGDYFQMSGDNVVILGLVSSDSGMYQCIGVNIAGNVQSSIYLQVLKPGQSIPVGNSTTSSTGNTADVDLFVPTQLQPLLTSTRFITLAWKPPARSHGKIISYTLHYKEVGSERERVRNVTNPVVEEINVQGLQPSKNYSFRVVPHGEAGIGRSTPEIYVLTQGEMSVVGSPKSLKATAASSTSIFVRWDAPEADSAIIKYYKVYYAEAGTEYPGISADSTSSLENSMEGGATRTETVTVTTDFTVLNNLKIFTEYYVWVVATSENGPGLNSEQVRVTTLSDVPASSPENVTVEPGSTAVVVRWEPPPLPARNGVITGYKVKCKQRGKKANTLTTDGNSRFISINELERGMEYQVKVAALNVNGTGPFTEWISTSTFERELDESTVPDKPNSLIARPASESITITWSPPHNPNVMVRGYTIGWGKGIPDVYSKLVDGKSRFFTIEDLKANSDYVISLRAYNQVGDGVPVYENVRTRPEESEADLADTRPSLMQLPPPVGLRAVVLSPTSVVLYWTDSSLRGGGGGGGSERRAYIARFSPADLKAYRYVNTTEQNVIINDLKPGVNYEFSVKVTRNRKSSEWSLVAFNRTTTLGTTPEPLRFSPPKDLTLLAVTGPDEISTVVLSWQPPKTNIGGEVKGYLLFYTTNPTLKEWVEETVGEDVLTHRVGGLTPDTTYYFKMSAKYTKAFSVSTPTKSVSTPLARSGLENRGSSGSNFGGSGRKPSGELGGRGERYPGGGQPLLYALIGVCILIALVSLTCCTYYRKRRPDDSPKRKKGGSSGGGKPELKPPDLWIHHDQMGFKSVEKTQTESLLGMGGKEFDCDVLEKIPLQYKMNSLDREGCGGGGDIGGKSCDTFPSAARGQQYRMTTEFGMGPATTPSQSTLNRRGSNLKSFNVQDGGDMGMTPPFGQRSMGGGGQMQGMGSPIHRLSGTLGRGRDLSPISYGTTTSSGGTGSTMQYCSNEDLSQEISNLEGLMKDLTAITASEFQC